MHTRFIPSVALAFVMCLGLLVMTTFAALADVQLDQRTKDYLEGAWLIDQQPLRGSCTSHDYVNDEYEFEFRKSGGRMILYQPFDLFTGVSFSGAERKGDVVILTVGSPPPNPGPYGSIHLRLLPPNRLEFIEDDSDRGRTGPKLVLFAYRCNRPDWSVTASLPASMQFILTAPASGETLFIEKRPGRGPCGAASGSDEPRWLQFEVLGPVHYFVMGEGFEGKFDLERLQSVRALNARTLQIEVLERQPGGPEVWDSGPRVKPYTLTGIWDGETLNILELHAVFWRCWGSPHRGYMPAPLPKPFSP